MRFVIGDIHGMSGMLDELLSLKEISEAEELVFIGDYIDKGPDPLGVIDRLIELERSRRTVFLMGNHEFVLLEYLAGDRGRRDFLLNYGGERFLREDRGGLKERHIAFLGKLKHYYLPDGVPYVCVHGGLREGDDLETGRYDLEKLVFTRKDFIGSRRLYKGRKIIFGHTASSVPYVDDYKIGVDTGAVYTPEGKKGVLSAFEMEQGFFLDSSGNRATLQEAKKRKA